MYKQHLQTRKRRLRNWMLQLPKTEVMMPFAVPAESNFWDGFIIDYTPADFPEITFGDDTILQSGWDQRYAS